MSRIAVIVNDRDYFLHHRLPVVERLVANGHKVTVIAGGTPEVPRQAGGWTYRYVHLDRLSINPVSNAALFFRFTRILREVRPDCLHLITLKPAVLAGLATVLMRKRDAPVPRLVITIPGLGRLMTPGSHHAGRFTELLRGGVGRAMRYLSNRRETTFTFETEHDRRVWIDSGYIREDNSVVVNGAGVDPERYSPAPERSSGKPLRVLFASRLLRSKGLAEFLRAAHHFADREDVVFQVAGWADQRDPDRMSEADLLSDDSIEFMGRIGDMPSLLRRADVVCLPTRYGEGIPRILIEAAACGVACIATDVHGCQTIVRHGQTGTIISSANEEVVTRALIAALEAYAGDRALAARHGDAGRKHFLSGGFKQEAVVDTFVELLTDPDAVARMNHQ